MPARVIRFERSPAARKERRAGAQLRAIVGGAVDGVRRAINARFPETS